MNPLMKTNRGWGRGGGINPSCVCVAETVLLTLLFQSLFVLVVVVVMFQNHQVMVTSFDWCWCCGDTPQSPDCWSSCNAQEKIVRVEDGGWLWYCYGRCMWEWYVKSRWEVGINAHENRYSSWWSDFSKQKNRLMFQKVI